MHKRIIVGGIVLSWALFTTSCSGDDDDSGAVTGGTTGGAAGAAATGGQAAAGGGTTATGGQVGAGADNGGQAGAGGAGGDAGGQAGAGGAGGAGSGLAIVGSYVDDYQSTHVITDTTWTLGFEGATPSVFHITMVSNPNQYLIAQNDAANQFSPSLWSRFDWTQSQGSLYYCQTTYDAATEEAALATPRANVDDLNKGCASFAWSKLTPS
jgi:hypothetical protein